MKKALCSIAALVAALQMNSQIFNAGFENNNGTPLSEFTTLNLDGNSVPFYAEVQDFNTEAWIQFYDGHDNKIAFSTSYYDPSGQSNDWLITAKIDVPVEGNPTLYWKGKSYDFDFTDSYAVKISETNNNPDSFVTLEQIDNEQAFEFASHSLNLSNYKGKSIYIAFVNNTYDGTYLALDDLYLSKSENCVMPDLSGFGVTQLMPNSVSVQWGSNPEINLLDTGLTTFDQAVTSSGTTASNTKTYTDLIPGKRYQFFLKNAVCGSGWAGPKSVFTPSTLPYSYDFEKTTENYGEYDSDGWSSYVWLNGENSEVSNAGNGYVYNNTSSSSTKNDWLFSYPVYLEAGETLNINYFAAIGNSEADPATLKVSIATAQETSSIISDLSTEIISESTYSEKSTQFTATNSGVYYVAFGNVTAPVSETTALRLDTINFTKESLSVSENSASKINIYPNPVADFLHIDSPSNLLKVEVFTADGSLILSQKSNQINFSNLPKGLYIVKLTTALGTKTEKVIKK